MQVTLDGTGRHDITEIGFGVSQIVPVIVAGLLQPIGSWYAVDLPEAHLHPRPQAAIADFFCSLALSGRSMLVETHSEMFVHRLRLRAAMNPSLMDRIAVYFIDRPTSKGCASPRSVGLSFEEELTWPEGFLQEAWETETQISAIREAMRR
jgi:predicted ATPase